MKKIFTTFLLVFTFTQTKAQIKIEPHVSVGMSIMQETNWEENDYPFSYSWSSSYNIGSDIYIPLKSGKYRLISGLDFRLLQSDFAFIDRFFNNQVNFPTKWTESYYSLDIPVKFGYAFEKWMIVSLGVSNRINFKSKHENYGTEKKMKNYTLALNSGVDFYINKKFIIGANYNRDLTTFVTLKDVEIYYSFEHVNLKLGYVLE